MKCSFALELRSCWLKILEHFYLLQSMCPKREAKFRFRIIPFNLPMFLFFLFYTPYGGPCPCYPRISVDEVCGVCETFNDFLERSINIGSNIGVNNLCAYFF